MQVAKLHILAIEKYLPRLGKKCHGNVTQRRIAPPILVDPIASAYGRIERLDFWTEHEVHIQYLKVSAKSVDRWIAEFCPWVGS